MKYDLTRCNNLRWRANGGLKGYVRFYDGQATLLLDKMCLTAYGLIYKPKCGCLSVHAVEDYIEANLPGFEIVSRDPETYRDWQVGDVVRNRNGIDCTIAARLGDLVFISFMEGGLVLASVVYFTCGELYRRGYRLVLTDYEKSLIGFETSKCTLKSDDKVLFRDNDVEMWKAGIFSRYAEEDPYPYILRYSVNGKFGFRQCIPYNEKTWQLLGATDNYKEE